MYMFSTKMKRQENKPTQVILNVKPDELMNKEIRRHNYLRFKKNQIGFTK